ncbi:MULTISPECIES: efflux RND transporter periplasmic adaptor subunit [Gimesia]|jgi:biotin carboxyl carrier protein|uniref:Efflux RND transporter periplasmic adaptor subunit n=2 Tax=Gimesia TaxID=1649453 RepID=A0A6I6AHW6_9PLAN|nr:MULTISPECIES: efflux RND transporter periplasmic adaptor subunit [Gimesia]MBP71938.1 secretion protein HlyD [Haliea sp.]QDT23456.1 HlyD family secretion protein [Gimesia chilikensis]QGQ25686.1 efflux RND transporter periplasmic adaptor subunit [Gimesia benthica]|tara:strand:+ start:2630 stop:4105 length:1476 start_codon:yes stop_codon:yes gene_type:complete
MRFQLSDISLKWYGLIAVLLISGICWGVRDTWLPLVKQKFSLINKQSGENLAGSQGEDIGHSGHNHGDPSHAHEDSTSLELSEQARRNIGLIVGEVALQTYERTLNIPAMIVERPGRTRIHITAPMTGIVTQIHIIEGEAIRSGMLMFKIRLTHEDLVQAQTKFLQTIGELEVENREIARLEKITSGIVAGKVILEREYARQKLNAILSAQKEALLLHGLSETQISQIESKRKLIRELLVYAPASGQGNELQLPEPLLRQVSDISQDSNQKSKKQTSSFVVQDLQIIKGQSVQSGQTLCILADFSELYIKGNAFEQDSNELHAAARNESAVSAVREDNQLHSEIINGLKFVYVANQVVPSSRAMHFYVGLTNEIERNKKTNDGHYFIDWKYKPGQRLRLRVPVEHWKNKIVLPIDAVAQEGAEFYVFLENGDHFDRVPVHVEYSDQYSVVIANDGSLFSGDAIALSGAHQMQVALKNKAGGGVDPHAGHNH